MGPGSELQVLFRVAAGPRIGFGHLIRARSLARALGVVPVVSLRGTPSTREAARRLGVTLAPNGDRGLGQGGSTSVMVIDDPSAVHAAAWVRRARRLRIPVATVHDLGLGYVQSDLAIDGSVRPLRAMRARAKDLRGPAYAILDPQVAHWRDNRPEAVEPDRVLIALGGGAHVLREASGLAEAIASLHPHARIRIASGFAPIRQLPALAAGEWITVRDGLAEELARCGVALLAGGVGLYEACALGVPGVAVALTPAQRFTIRAIAKAGAVIDGGRIGRRGQAAARLAVHITSLLNDSRARRRLAEAGRALVDARGAYRVAERLKELAGRTAEARHAA